MQIVRIGADSDEEAAVHTIDIWYSERRRAWMVERLDGAGHHVGVSLFRESRADALACAAEWLRSHPETCLISPLLDQTPRAVGRPTPRQAKFSKASDLRHDPPSVSARA